MPENGFEGMCWEEIVEHTAPDPRDHGMEHLTPAEASRMAMTYFD